MYILVGFLLSLVCLGLLEGVSFVVSEIHSIQPCPQRMHLVVFTDIKLDKLVIIGCVFADQSSYLPFLYCRSRSILKTPYCILEF